MIPVQPNAIPSEAPPNVPKWCRGSTTVLANVVLAIAALGFLGSSLVLLSAILIGKTSIIPHSVGLINSALAVLSKVALWVLGVFLIRRLSKVRVVAAAGLAISLIDSAYYIIAVVPHMGMGVSAASERGLGIGAWIPAAVSAILYAGILVYLAQPASRQEFRRTNA